MLRLRFGTCAVTNGCEQLHADVFRALSLEKVITQAKTFFSMMPNVVAESGDTEKSLETETDKMGCVY